MLTTTRTVCRYRRAFANANSTALGKHAGVVALPQNTCPTYTKALAIVLLIPKSFATFQHAMKCCQADGVNSSYFRTLKPWLQARRTAMQAAATLLGKPPNGTETFDCKTTKKLRSHPEESLKSASRRRSLTNALWHVLLRPDTACTSK